MRGGNGRLQPGNAGGPGRPKGSLHRGTVDARQIKSELLASWRKHGPAALETVARERPLDYPRLVVSLLPADSEAGPPRLEGPVLPPPPRHSSSSPGTSCRPPGGSGKTGPSKRGGPASESAGSNETTKRR